VERFPLGPRANYSFLLTVVFLTPFQHKACNVCLKSIYLGQGNVAKISGVSPEGALYGGLYDGY